MHVMFSFHVIFPQNFTGNGILFQFRRNIYHGKQPLMTAMTMIVIWWLFILVMVLGDCVTMMPCCCCCRYCCSPYMIIWLHTTLHDDPHPKNSTKSGVRRSHSNYVMDVCMYVCGEGGGLVVRLSVFNADVVNVSTINCESDFCDVSILPYFDVLFSCCFIHPHKKYEDITSSHQAKK